MFLGKPLRAWIMIVGNDTTLRRKIKEFGIESEG